MRVLVVTESYLPYVSGVTVSTETLARGLGRRGHDVMLMAPRPRHGEAPGTAGAVGPEPTYAWLPSYQWPRPVPAGYRMPSPIPSRRTMESALAFRPDVVHVQSPFVAGRLGRRVARVAGVPLVLTHHTRLTEYRHYLWPVSGLGAAVVDSYTRRFWGSCTAVVAPSTDFATEIVASLRRRGAPLVWAIPTGIDVDGIASTLARDPRAEHGWPADALVVASLGRLEKEKSVGTLLEAMALAAAHEPRLRILVVGGGTLEPSLRARSERADLAGRVGFAGPLRRTEALALLKGSDLFAFASQTETQGLVLAEALACGLPVVALAGPGVRDTLSDGEDAVIVPHGPDTDRPTVLGDAIAALAADDERRGALAAAALRSARGTDVDVRLAELESLYERSLAVHGERSRLPRPA